MNTIELSIFSNRIDAICDEMGAVLRRAAFSPNIMDRLDFSCALFDAEGELCAQAAHIPVHLGSMAFAMRDIVRQVQWQDGDMVILNDPFLGGTHLPDVTIIAPLFINEILLAFVVNRAHHADIGAESPGSMPISGRLDEEGMVIPPSRLVRAGSLDEDFLQHISQATRNPREARGDFAAQISANRSGLIRLRTLVNEMGIAGFRQALVALNAYAETLARNVIRELPDGQYTFTDFMDDDGMGARDVPIAVNLQVNGDGCHLDFSGTAEQVRGNINCPLSVTAAAVYYVFRCLMPDYTPASSGSFRPISLYVPEGSLVNAKRPAAVAAGNVETSTRLVDVVMGALAKAVPQRIPAASHGSMNNLAMGSADPVHPWDYYETMGGGMGAGARSRGLNAVQTHMTNTLNTPIEVLEMRYPVRVRQYSIREDSGGHGQHNGGDGLVREFEFLRDASVTLLSERRSHAPWGIEGGGDGKCGRNWHNDTLLPAKCSFQVKAGDRVKVETPGGGAWGTSGTGIQE